MTGAAWGALGAFAVLAVLDWVSHARDDNRLEAVVKPLATVALIALALALDPADSTQRAWFVAALAFSLGGDIALLDDDRFVIGLASFLIAHVCYVIGFWVDEPSAGAVVIATVVTVVAIAPLARRIVTSIRRSSTPELAVPVIAYVTVIGAMVVSALASGSALAAVGAILFAGSDSMIAWNKFVRPFAAASVAIMVTYHLGQLGLVVSLLKQEITMRRSIDDAASDDLDDDDRPRVSWAVAIADDYDDGEPRLVLTVEEVGRAGTGLVAHLGPDGARRLRLAIRDALREIGADSGP